MHIQTVIEQLGYSPSEVKLYLAALDLGESSITALAANVRMPRTSVQTIIESMHRKGLMNCFVLKRRRMWVAENPEKLMITLKEREAALKSILPELQSKRFAQGGRPVIRVYNGVEEIKRIMDEIIDAKRHINAIVDWDNWKDFFGPNFMDDFIERRHKHFLKIQLITPRTPKAIELQKQDDTESRSTRFLPQHIHIKTSNFIYGNAYAIISLNRRRPVGIVMEDPDNVYTAALLFDSLWAASSSRVA